MENKLIGFEKNSLSKGLGRGKGEEKHVQSKYIQKY